MSQKIHKLLWLNCALMDQNEEFLPEVTSMEFSIDNAGYGPFIRNRLHYVHGDLKCECQVIGLFMKK
jgi:hypothetical protein